MVGAWSYPPRAGPCGHAGAEGASRPHRGLEGKNSKSSPWVERRGERLVLKVSEKSRLVQVKGQAFRSLRTSTIFWWRSSKWITFGHGIEVISPEIPAVGFPAAQKGISWSWVVFPFFEGTPFQSFLKGRQKDHDDFVGSAKIDPPPICMVH